MKLFEWGALTDDQPEDEPVELVMHVGPIDRPGEEMFTVHLCTPAARIKLRDRDGLPMGRHYRFIGRIDADRVEAFINDRLRRLDGDTWQQLADKIARIGYWEFEDSGRCKAASPTIRRRPDPMIKHTR